MPPQALQVDGRVVLEYTVSGLTHVWAVYCDYFGLGTVLARSGGTITVQQAVDSMVEAVKGMYHNSTSFSKGTLF